MVTRFRVSGRTIQVRRRRVDAVLITAGGAAGMAALAILTVAGTILPAVSLLPFLLALAAFWTGLGTLRRQGLETLTVDTKKREIRTGRGASEERTIPFASITSIDITRGTLKNLFLECNDETVVLFESMIHAPRIMRLADMLGNEGIKISPYLLFLLERRGKTRRMALAMILFLWLSATLTWLILR